MALPASPRTPVHDFLNVPSAPASLTLAAPAGMICLLNLGANDVWITCNGVAPAAADGAGQTRLKSGGPALNLTNTNVTVVKANSGAAGAIQIVWQQAADQGSGVS